MQFATTGDAEFVGVSGVVDTQGNVVFKLQVEAFANLSAGQEFAILAGKRGLVDLERHVDGRLVDRKRRQSLLVVRIAQRV